MSNITEQLNATEQFVLTTIQQEPGKNRNALAARAFRYGHSAKKVRKALGALQEKNLIEVRQHGPHRVLVPVNPE